MRNSILATPIALIFSAALAGAGDQDRDFYHDFRGQPLPDSLTLFPPKESSHIKAQPEGLRITLPKDRPSLLAVGLARDVPIKGDFEITLTYEILEAEAPPPNTFGVGVSLFVKKAEPRAEGATLCRLVRDNGKQVIFWDRSHLVPGKEPRFEGNATHCTDKVGRLRLHRTGTVLSYLRAAGLVGDDFQEIHRAEFGADDIQRLELRGTTGRYPCKLDARFLDLRIRSGAIGPVRAVTAPPRQAPPQGPEKGRRLLFILAAVAVVLALMGLGLILRRFTRRKSSGAAAASSDAVEVSCPHCQKRLRVPAGTVGSKVKCPGCEKGFLPSGQVS